MAPAQVVTDFRQLPTGKCLYFASDFHLGAGPAKMSDEREKKIVRWLQAVSHDAAAIFLVGDIFDFWFEYKKVIPKGFIRFQAALLELRDRGIPVYFFTGNHDKWLFDYFPAHFGIPVFYRPVVIEVNGQRLYVGHGDGLGPGDRWYKVLKVLFEGRFPQALFRWLHPDIGVWLAHRWSKSSRITSGSRDEGFIKPEGEWLWQYAREVEQTQHHDYYIFGHRHIPLDLEVTEKSRYLNLGEWVNHYTYVKYDGAKADLLVFGD